MTYEELRYSAPKGLQKKSKKVRPMEPKQVMIFLAVAMLIFAIFGSAIQYALGMVGVLITEIYLLIISVLYVKWSGHPIKKVFPIRKPKLSAVFGTIVMWIGAYMLMILSNMWMLVLDPAYAQNGDAEVIMGSDLSWLFLFPIVAIVPAVCEEAMHRGVLQYGLKKKINNPWIMALVIGLIFGLFHMDRSKFLATGLLGGVMGWMMFQTDNMVYSSLFHFIHNGMQMLLLLVMPAVAMVPGIAAVPFAAGVSDGMNLSIVCISAGITTMGLGILIPGVFYFGNWLLLRDVAPKRVPLLPSDAKERKKIGKMLLKAIGCFILFGFILIILGFLSL